MTPEAHPHAVAKTKLVSQTDNPFISLPPCTDATLERGRVACQRACVASVTSGKLAMRPNLSTVNSQDQVCPLRRLQPEFQNTAPQMVRRHPPDTCSGVAIPEQRAGASVQNRLVLSKSAPIVLNRGEYCSSNWWEYRGQIGRAH